MNKLLKLKLLIAPLFFFGAAVACDYPERVSVPNGSTATNEEMLEAQKAIKDYMSNMESYLVCIESEEKQARNAMENLSPEDEQEREDLLNKKYNAAVEEMERTAALFNAEVRAFRANAED